MLKFLFWGLLLANAALFAFDRGYLGSFLSDGREPARLLNQLNADKIKLKASVLAPVAVPAADATTAASVASAAPALVAVAVPATKVEVIACTEIGNFDAADAKRFGAQLTALATGAKVTRRNIKDVARHMVYIPSQGDKDAADKKSAELKRLGINDFYVIQENSDMRWGISLGIFKTEDAARLHLATLSAKGVRSARLGTHSVTSNRVAFQLRDVDEASKDKLDKLRDSFPRQDFRKCDA